RCAGALTGPRCLTSSPSVRTWGGRLEPGVVRFLSAPLGDAAVRGSNPAPGATVVVRWASAVASCFAERAGFEPAVRLPVHMISNHAPSASRSPLQAGVRSGERTLFSSRRVLGRFGAFFLGKPLGGADLGLRGAAERVGFEPTVPLRAHLISNQAPSATRSSLRGGMWQHA